MTISATAVDARTYTGEFPPNQPDMTVDELVASLVAAVDRVRIKYAMAVEDIAARQGGDVEDVLSWIDRRFEVQGDEYRARKAEQS